MNTTCKHEREIILDGKKYYACMKNQDFDEWRCKYRRWDCYEEKEILTREGVD